MRKLAYYIRKNDGKAVNWNRSKQRQNSAIKTKMVNKLKIQMNKIQLEQIANRVGSYFPKDGHSAPKTELKV